MKYLSFTNPGPNNKSSFKFAALTELSLNDASISLAPEMSVVLGQGWKIGFLGRLHMEVWLALQLHITNSHCSFLRYLANV